MAWTHAPHGGGRRRRPRRSTDHANGKTILVLYPSALLPLLLFLLTSAQGYEEDKGPIPPKLLGRPEVISISGGPVLAGKRPEQALPLSAVVDSGKDGAWLSAEAKARGRTLKGAKTWKLGEKPETGSRPMRIVDLTVPSLDASQFKLPKGANKSRDALLLDADPTSCGTPTACPHFKPCSSGGGWNASRGANGEVPATGAISMCSNSWLTVGDVQQNASDPQGFRCNITIEPTHHGMERVKDEPEGCAETEDVFGEAAGGGSASTGEGWRGGVALLENVYVNQHGDVFNDTHHFYFGACTQTSEEKRTPARLFVKFPYGKTTEVLEVEELVNLDIGPLPQNHFLEQVYRLPLIVQLAPLLPSLNESMFLVGEHKVLHSALGHLLGISPWGRLIQPPADGQHLLLVRRLIQPIHQHCGRPSTASWDKIRASLRIPGGTPLFHSNWTSRMPPSRPPRPPSPLAPEAYPLDWAVVLGVPSASQSVRTRSPRVPNFSVQDLVSNEFWMDHVVEVKELPQKAVELFNRTVALITAPGAALSAIPFMPRGAYIILLAPHDVRAGSPESKRRKKESPVYLAHAVELQGEVMRAVRGLARAAGIHLAVVACPVELVGEKGAPLAAPELVCGNQPISDAVSWAASQVYRWKSLPGPGGRPRKLSFDDSIPGSGLRNKAAVQDFKAWQECVGTNGSWARDPLPRPLPWPYANLYHGGGCDGGEANYLTSKEAIPVVDQWRAGNKSALQDWERIRPGLRYHWSVDPQACRPLAQKPDQAAGVLRPLWKEGNRTDFCSIVPEKKRTIVFIGDSLQEQMVAAMLYTMLMDWPRIPLEKSRFLRYIPEDVDVWIKANNVSGRGHYPAFSFRVPSCPPMELVYLRSVHLNLAVSSVPKDFRWIYLAWAKDMRGQLEKAGTIVINRGAWFEKMPFFARDLAATCRFLRFTFPDKLIVFRNTVPGHVNCSLYREPMQKRLDVPDWAPYSWGSFLRENARAKSIVESFGMVYLDVYAQTQFRADGHKGHNAKGTPDCLHYCFPGPVDTWIQLLYNTMAQLKIPP